MYREGGKESFAPLCSRLTHKFPGVMNLLGYLVRRYAHPTDRRNRVIRLTAAGRKLIEKAFREHASVMEDIGKSLSPEERGVLIKLLKRLGKGAEELLRRTS